MSKGLPTFIRKDEHTGPYFLTKLKKRPLYYKLLFNRVSTRLPLYHSLFGRGSREHFYHFLIGYLLPLVHAQSKYRFDRFLALDCGPLMTPILHETLTRLGYNFDLVLPDKIERPVYVDVWDHGWSKAGGVRNSVKAAQTLIERAWAEYVCARHPCPRSENLLIQRSSPHEYYLDGRSEGRGYGTSRRGITNLHDVSDYLSSNGVQNLIYEPGVHCLGCQIEAFRAAKRLLGFRGAEWASLIWSTPDVRVRILDADPPAWLIGRFMDGLDIKHEFSIVALRHSPEDPQEALRFFNS